MTKFDILFGKISVIVNVENAVIMAAVEIPAATTGSLSS